MFPEFSSFLRQKRKNIFQLCTCRDTRYSMYGTFSCSQLKWALITAATHYRDKFIPTFGRYVMWYLVYFRAIKLIVTIWFSHILSLIILIGCSTAEHCSSAVWLRLIVPLWLILNFISMCCMFAIRKSAVRILICTHFWYLVILEYIYVVFFWRFDSL